MKFAFSLAACALLASGTATAQDRSARSLRDLMDADLTLNGRHLGRVSDVTFTDKGAIRDLIVRTDGGLVAVPYAAVRYDDRERGYVVAPGIRPRPYRAEAREPAPAPARDRFSRGGRLVREEPPTARIERTIERTPRPYEFSSPQLADMAYAARVYSTPSFSLSMTGNVDRLPARSATISNVTLPSELYGWRAPYFRQTQPAPIPSGVPTTAK
jgi:hypothetical protein